MLTTKTFPWLEPKLKIIHRDDIERKDGEVRLYMVDGVGYPSVTTILSILNANEDGTDPLDAWRERVGHEEAERITEEAADRGTHLHLIAEMYLNNKLDRTLLKGQASVLFRQMKKYIDKISTVIGTEVTLYNKTLSYAGSADCVAIYDGKLSIIDFKNTRKTINLNYKWNREKLYGYRIQTAMYALALEDMTGIEVPQGVLIVGNMDNLDSTEFVFKLDYYKKQAKQIIHAYHLGDRELIKDTDYYKL